MKIIACAVVVGAVSAAFGQIGYVDQGRYVRTSALGESDRIDAEGFGVFDETLDVLYSQGQASASGFASQFSVLEPGGMTASARVEGSSGPPAGTSVGAGTSVFNVTFRLERVVAYTLEAEGEAEAWSYLLEGPGLDLLGFATGTDGSFELSEEGLLPPGEYLFDVFVRSAFFSGEDDGFDFAFTVTAEGCSGADIAPPLGLLDLEDVTAFVTAFQNGEAFADIDGSGLLDLTDVTEFVTAFLAGCG